MAAQSSEILLIGAGTMLSGARALTEHPEIGVTVFDSNNRVGGHIHTIYVCYTTDGQAHLIDKENIRFRENGRPELKDDFKPPAGKQWLKNKSGGAFIIPFEGGAEFIGPPELYTNVHILFKQLNVRLKPFELNMFFDDRKNRKQLVLPPRIKTSAGVVTEASTSNQVNPKFKDPTQRTSFFDNILSFFKPNKIGDEKEYSKIHLETLGNFPDLLRLFHAIEASHLKLKPHKEHVTLEQFINGIIAEEIEPFASQFKKFADEILYKFIAAGWGVSPDEIKTFGAYYGMLYLGSGSQWYDATTGLSTYMNKLEEQIHEASPNAIKLNTEVRRLVPVVHNGSIQYKAQLKDGRFAQDSHGQDAVYNDVVLSTPAHVTRKILENISPETVTPLIAQLPKDKRKQAKRQLGQLLELKELMAKITYYKTTIAFHQDPSWESEHDTVVHTRVVNGIAGNTMCKRWKQPKEITPVMKSWVLEGQGEPENVVHQVQYHHPVMDEHYHQLQMKMREYQDSLNLSFGGILAGLNDSHESGLTAALENSYRLIKKAGLNPEENAFLKPHLKTITPDATKKAKPRFSEPCFTRLAGELEIEGETIRLSR